MRNDSSLELCCINPIKIDWEGNVITKHNSSELSNIQVHNLVRKVEKDIDNILGKYIGEFVTEENKFKIAQDFERILSQNKVLEDLDYEIKTKETKDKEHLHVQIIPKNKRTERFFQNFFDEETTDI